MMGNKKICYEIAALAVGVVVCVSSCGPGAIENIGIRFDSPAATASPTPMVFADGAVDVENVRFDFDAGLIERVEVSETPGFRLEDENSKPSVVGARSLDFVLRDRKGDERAWIAVFKIAEYKEAFSLVPHYLGQRDEDLRSVIRNSSLDKTWGIDQPVHVRWLDASHDFYAKAQVVNFKGGRGLLMLTQIGVDAASLITNEGIEYYFQGMTDDGVYFVEMSFVVNMAGLPPSMTPAFAKDYGLPEAYYLDQHREIFRKYAMKMAKEIDSAPDDRFDPNPNQIRAFIESFQIR